MHSTSSSNRTSMKPSVLDKTIGKSKTDVIKFCSTRNLQLIYPKHFVFVGQFEHIRLSYIRDGSIL